MKIGFIGFGRMGSALAAGAIDAGALSAKQVIAYDVDSKVKAQARRLKISWALNLAAVLQKADLIFLAVKPQQMKTLWIDLQNIQGQRYLRRKGFVSIAAGITLKQIERGLGNHVSVMRVMPNTPALLKSGMAAVSRGRHVTPAQRKMAEKILGSVGEVIFVNDKHLDAITAVSGSGPAYVFYLAESMIQGAVKQGLQKNVARLLVHQTLFGAGRMLKERSETAEQLRVQVTSPGGTTAAAIGEFEKRKLKNVVVAAIDKATRRSKELSK